jgi:hypothetical protein
MARWIATLCWWIAWLLFPLTFAADPRILPPDLPLDDFPSTAWILWASLHNSISSSMRWFAGWALITVLLSLYDAFAGETAPRSGTEP